MPTSLQDIVQSDEPGDADYHDDDDDDGEVAISDMSEEEGGDPGDDSQMQVAFDDAMEADTADAVDDEIFNTGVVDETAPHDDGNSQVVQGTSDVTAPCDDDSDVEVLCIKDSEDKRSESEDAIIARQKLEDKIGMLTAMLHKKQKLETAQTFGFLIFVAS